MAAASRIDIVVDGHAGHAAMPHLSRDPLLASAHLLVALQTLVSRNTDPLESAVVSICVMNAGVAVNQIPSQAALRGTFRSHRRSVRDLIEAGIRPISSGIAATFGVEVAVHINHGVSATINTQGEADLAAFAAAELGAAVRRDLPPSMAGEDFGWYLEQKPGAFVWIGNGPSRPGGELHNPGYDYNDAILPVAAGWLATTARRALAF